jgi:hypothetical protein
MINTSMTNNKQLLASDILESQFGECKITVLRQQKSERAVAVAAMSNLQILELAHVTFAPNAGEQHHDAHKHILAGEAMGKTFKSLGVPFFRQTRMVSISTLPANLKTLMAESKRATVVEVTVYVGHDPIAYAQILEIYSSKVAWPERINTPSTAVTKALERFEAYMYPVRAMAVPYNSI